jgi:chromosome segregation ATPase
VCPEHQALANQTAENLGRRVSFAPLPQYEQPMQRSERAKLKGEVYAAEAEIVDLKARGLNLYNENTALTRQLQARTARLQETELQLRDKQAECELLQEALDKRDAEAGDANDELQRLRTLAKLLPPEAAESAERHTVGLNG